MTGASAPRPTDDLDGIVLVPRPRRVELLGGDPVGPDAPVHAVASPSLAPEGFVLHLTAADGARITHRDDAGLRHARQTLAQLRSQVPGGRVPALRIEDHPDIAVRGFMLDISRDRVPTRATLVRIVELASLVRLNQLQLYTEHTFAYRDHRDVWATASPMTPADIAWLDDLCAAAGIELVPNQNCFGHMGRWLAHDRYRPRAESPDGWDLLPGVPMPPETLAPTPESARFALDLLDELLPCFRSRRVHIGCDEPFELGRGRSADRVASEGRGEVYVDHVARIAGPLSDRGHEVQVWADVLREHPTLAARLPSDTVPVAWCYEAPLPGGAVLEVPPEVRGVLDSLGIDPGAFSGFAPNVAPLVEAEVPFWVAPGASGWCSLVGRLDNAVANAVDAAETARAHGSGGLLLTEWGDAGHLQPPSVAFGPLVHAGAVAWGLDANRDLDLGAVLDVFVHRDPTGRLSTATERLGRLWRRTGQQAVNGSPLSAALLPDHVHMVFGRPDPDAVREVVAEIDEAIDQLAGAAPASEDGATTVAELTQAARLARHGARRLLGDEGRPPEAVDADMATLVEAQRDTWLARSRPGGLRDSLARLDPARAATIDIPPVGDL